MNILVTGARGFVGQNLVQNLRCLAEGKNRTRPQLSIGEIYEYDVQTPPELLESYCQKADFVFHLAGVNRTENSEQFMEGNFGFSSLLLDTLKRVENPCPVMLSSSIQASLLGRYAESEYGKSKLAGENLFFAYGQETGAPVLVYRFPNLFGKWCRPHYNSVVATFCYRIARNMPIEVHDPHTELELLYIDDLVEEMLDALEGHPHRCGYEGVTPVPGEGAYCYVPTTHKTTLGALAAMLYRFHDQPKTLVVPAIAEGSFEKKLYSTYLSYLPEEQVAIPLKINGDERGSFTELMRLENGGQVSVNITRPGVTKGQHWHNTKWEFFMVVSGHGRISQRRIGTDEEGKPFPVWTWEVDGKAPQAVHMLPGCTHALTNLSEHEDLITVMWANEHFDPQHPDTFFEKVEE